MPCPGSLRSVNVESSGFGSNHAVDQLQPAGGVVDPCGHGCPRVVGRLDDQLDNVLAILERTPRCGEAERQVVPGPSVSEAGPRLRRAAVHDVVIADEPSIDSSDAKSPEIGRPSGEEIVVGSSVRGVDGGVARAAHDQVAPERALLDRRRGQKLCLVPVVPPQLVGSRGQRQDLQRGGRDEQYVIVESVQRLVADRATVPAHPRRYGPPQVR